MFTKTLVILTIGTLGCTSLTIDYCSEKLCDFQDGKTYQHVACNNTGVSLKKELKIFFN